MSPPLLICTPLNLHSCKSKSFIHRSLLPVIILGQKATSTTSSAMYQAAGLCVTSRNGLQRAFSHSQPMDIFSVLHGMASNCNGFEITSTSEKHMVEDDILFTNHLAGKLEILAEAMECYPST